MASELDAWYDRKEDIIYMQAKENLIKKEVLNNKFFRRRRNHINTLMNEDGKWVSKKEEHFIKIYTLSDHNIDINIFKLITPCITEDENQKLTQMPSAEKVKEAIYNINAWVAPGPISRLLSTYLEH